MAKKIKDIEPTGEYVILKMVEVKQEAYEKKGQLFVPGGVNSNPQQTSKVSWEAFIYKIGPDVENPNFKVGDNVVFNDYDVKYIGDNEIFGVTQARSVMAVIETTEE